jgi:hypothetical protein
MLTSRYGDLVDIINVKQKVALPSSDLCDLYQEELYLHGLCCSLHPKNNPIVTQEMDTQEASFRILNEFHTN